ncbi:hypothetical protein CLOM_g4135 [Closterium sp. NIES-68]|nr:hypothetical protein CLOM_g4135 [Closterium sp. NIES-68]
MEKDMHEVSNLITDGEGGAKVVAGRKAPTVIAQTERRDRKVVAAVKALASQPSQRGFVAEGMSVTWTRLQYSVPSTNSKWCCLRAEDDATIYRKKVMMNVTGGVAPGNLLAVMGPEGSGKSLLLHMLAGRLQDDPNFRGSIDPEGSGKSLLLHMLAGRLQDDPNFRGSIDPEGSGKSLLLHMLAGRLQDDPNFRGSIEFSGKPFEVHLPLPLPYLPFNPHSPEGSGKSLLLHMLAGRLQDDPNFRGSIEFSGKPFGATLRREIGFVENDVDLQANLTVKETLMFAAMLRLPEGTEEIDQIVRVEHVLDSLELTHCADKVIGRTGRNAVLYNELRRLAIGVQMIVNPPLLLLDEPTSGLDGAMALRITRALHSYALAGRSVVATMKQPSAKMFSLFTHLLLITDGNPIFFGAAGAALPYFDSIGYTMGADTSAAEFFLDLTAPEAADASIHFGTSTNLIRLWATGDAAREIERAAMPSTAATVSQASAKSGEGGEGQGNGDVEVGEGVGEGTRVRDVDASMDWRGVSGGGGGGIGGGGRGGGGSGKRWVTSWGLQFRVLAQRHLLSYRVVNQDWIFVAVVAVSLLVCTLLPGEACWQVRLVETLWHVRSYRVVNQDWIFVAVVAVSLLVCTLLPGEACWQVRLEETLGHLLSYRVVNQDWIFVAVVAVSLLVCTLLPGEACWQVRLEETLGHLLSYRVVNQDWIFVAVVAVSLLVCTLLPGEACWQVRLVETLGHLLSYRVVNQDWIFVAVVAVSLLVCTLLPGEACWQVRLVETLGHVRSYRVVNQDWIFVAVVAVSLLVCTLLPGEACWQVRLVETLGHLLSYRVVNQDWIFVAVVAVSLLVCTLLPGEACWQVRLEETLGHLLSYRVVNQDWIFVAVVAVSLLVCTLLPGEACWQVRLVETLGHVRSYRVVNQDWIFVAVVAVSLLVCTLLPGEACWQVRLVETLGHVRSYRVVNQDWIFVAVVAVSLLVCTLLPGEACWQVRLVETLGHVLSYRVVNQDWIFVAVVAVSLLVCTLLPGEACWQVRLVETLGHLLSYRVVNQDWIFVAVVAVSLLVCTLLPGEACWQVRLVETLGHLLSYRVVNQDWIFVAVVAVSLFVCTLLPGCLWYKRDPTTAEGIRDMAGLIFFSQFFWGLIPMLTSVITFLEDRKSVQKEQEDGVYHISAYYAARTLLSLPYEILPPVFYSCIVYWMTGLNPSGGRFVLFTLVLVLDTMVASSIGMAVGTATSTVKQAISIAAILQLLSVMVVHFLSLNPPAWVGWTQYLSFSTYVNKLLMRINFDSAESFTGNCSASNTSSSTAANTCSCAATLELSGLRNPLPGSGWLEACILVAMLIFFRLLALLIVKLRLQSWRWHRNGRT